MKNIRFILLLFLTTVLNIYNPLLSRDYQIESLKEVVWLEQEWALDHWRTYFKEKSYYDEDNKLVLEITQILVNDEWEDNKKIIYYYDTNNRLTKKESYSVNEENWELNDSIIYIYNIKGKLIENIQRLKIENTWTDYLKYNYFYDEYDNDTLEIKWKYIDDKWEYFYMIKKFWEKNKKSQTILYMISDNEWLQKTKNVYTYNNLELLDNIITYAWINYDWMYSSRLLYLYDEKHRQIEQIYQLPTDTGWENQQSYATIYDAEGNEAVLITYQWRNGVKEGFQRSIRESYLSVNDITSEKNFFDFEIFPNPTKEYINLFISNITNDVKICIYNLLGQKVYNITKDNSTSYLIINNIDLSKLENGIYFIQIEHNGKYLTKRLIIDK